MALLTVTTGPGHHLYSKCGLEEVQELGMFACACRSCADIIVPGQSCAFRPCRPPSRAKTVPACLCKISMRPARCQQRICTRKTSGAEAFATLGYQAVAGGSVLSDQEWQSMPFGHSFSCPGVTKADLAAGCVVISVPQETAVLRWYHVIPILQFLEKECSLVMSQGHHQARRRLTFASTTRTLQLSGSGLMLTCLPTQGGAIFA